jgi:hypothetical protein
MQNPMNGHVPNTATITIRVPSEPRDTAPASTPAVESQATTCVCGHPQAQHDAIATRYCLATAVSHLTRGCVCADTAVPQG